MKRYLVKLIFSVEGKELPEFDEQMRMIASNTATDALFKARRLGRTEEGAVEGSNGALAWKFIDVADVYDLDEHADGGYIFSTTRHTDDRDSYIGYVKSKAMAIQAKNLTFA